MSTAHEKSARMRRRALSLAAVAAAGTYGISLSSCNSTQTNHESRPARSTPTLQTASNTVKTIAPQPENYAAIQSHIPSASSLDPFTQTEGISDNMTCRIVSSFNVVPRLQNGQIDVGHTAVALQMSFADSDTRQKLVDLDTGVNVSSPLINYVVNLQSNTIAYEGNYQMPSFGAEAGTVVTVPASASIPGTILAIHEDQTVTETIPGELQRYDLTVPCGAFIYTDNGWKIDTNIHMTGSVGSGAMMQTPENYSSSPTP
ncbi:MAG TPA: hypothetical protein VFN56_05220 [Candidatus Saccharimonadales bacterium]|nr:hypothetical protein [Candidatus Saccharimonadales bacterium]